MSLEFYNSGRLFYLADPEAGEGGDKEAAELWAYSAAVMPAIHECDPDVAATIRANTDIERTTAPMSEGYVSLKEELESVYSCLGVSCSQVHTKQLLYVPVQSMSFLVVFIVIKIPFKF